MISSDGNLRVIFSTGERGQTIVGLLVVVAIVGGLFWYLATGGGPGESPGVVKKNIEEGREVARESELKVLRQAISLYRAEQGEYPENLRTLSAEGYVPDSALTGPEGEVYDYNPETGKVQ